MAEGLYLDMSLSEDDSADDFPDGHDDIDRRGRRREGGDGEGDCPLRRAG